MNEANQNDETHPISKKGYKGEDSGCGSLSQQEVGGWRV